MMCPIMSYREHANWEESCRSNCMFYSNGECLIRTALVKYITQKGEIQYETPVPDWRYTRITCDESQVPNYLSSNP